MSKNILSLKKLVEIYSDPVLAAEQLNLDQLTKASISDLDVNFIGGDIEFVRGNGTVNFQRDSVSTYIGIDGILKKAVKNQPKIESEGLLIESQSLNYIKKSEDFTGTGVNALIQASVGLVAPDNTSTVQKITETNTTSEHYINFVANSQIFPIQSLGSTSTPSRNKVLTFSTFIRAAERKYVRLRYLDSSNQNRATVVYDLEAGTILSFSQNFDTSTFPDLPSFFLNTGSTPYCSIKKISRVGEFEFDEYSWYRISLTFYTGADSGDFKVVLGFTDSIDNWSYAGSTTAGVYVWGAQLEPMPYPTSYIYSNNFSSPPIRYADYCWISNADLNVPFPYKGQTTYIVNFNLLGRYHFASTKLTEYDPTVLNTSHNYAYLTRMDYRWLFSLAGFNYQLGSVLKDGNIISYYNRDWASYVGPLDQTTETEALFNNTLSAAFVFDSNVQSTYLNGDIKLETNVTVPAYSGIPTHINIGHHGSVSSNKGEDISRNISSGFLNGHISSFRIFKRALNQEDIILL
jgi:hypothetical protein